MDVIQTVYTYANKNTRGRYEIGKSLFGLPLYAFEVKKTAYPKVIVIGGMHAREYITCYLTMYLAQDFIKRGKRGTVYFIPMLNPDGIRKVVDGDSLYKANGRGVDLNVNFDAGWGEGEKNVRVSGPENFIGDKPFSEPETAALRDFTLKLSPDATLSFHSKGQEIYYGFRGKRESDRILAEKIAEKSGYVVKPTPNSAGGYKDWCVDKLCIPSFTVEVGDDALSHPITKESLKSVIYENAQDIIILTENL
ncbi:MAG: M14 family zinc carboxypeptidase, partial [Clostridia bacterium]|nr:M14 family zinc carboxypeptidase [Clostridia bacterium]